MPLTDQRKRAVARARKALDTERAGVLPDDVNPDAAQAFWRGWLRQALTTLLRDLTDDEEE